MVAVLMLLSAAQSNVVAVALITNGSGSVMVSDFTSSQPRPDTILTWYSPAGRLSNNGLLCKGLLGAPALTPINSY